LLSWPDPACGPACRINGCPKPAALVFDSSNYEYAHQKNAALGDLIGSGCREAVIRNSTNEE
jgi:hypothetical protein